MFDRLSAEGPRMDLDAAVPPGADEIRRLMAHGRELRARAVQARLRALAQAVARPLRAAGGLPRAGAPIRRAVPLTRCRS